MIGLNGTLAVNLMRKLIFVLFYDLYLVHLTLTFSEYTYYHVSTKKDMMNSVGLGLLLCVRHRDSTNSQQVIRIKQYVCTRGS